MQWKVPLFEPDLGPDELQAVQAPIRDSWLTMGQITAEFEREFARRCGVRHALAVTNCTAGLHLAVLAAGIGPGDEVICPAITFVATANAIMHAGATPVFCGAAGANNVNMDLRQLEDLIGPRTRAILVMHYGGFPLDMPAVLKIAAQRGIAIIEDCAHALFSTLRGRCCGTWGRVGAFSFFGNKNMTCGEGGMVVTDDDEVAEHVRSMRSHGMTTVTLQRYHGAAPAYDVVDVGFNYRLDEIRSSLALAQLRRLDHFLVERQRVRDAYCLRLAGSDLVVPDFDWSRISQAGDRIGHHLMPVVLPEGISREAVIESLKSSGIQTSIHYRPVHTFTGLQGLGRSGPWLEETERLAARELTLPMYTKLTEEQIDFVCESLLDAVSNERASGRPSICLG